jgi:diguanylate cyclase (GGDEF)-like protein
VWVWEDDAQELSCGAISGDRPAALEEVRLGPQETPHLAAMLDDPKPVPLFFDRTTEDKAVRGLLDRFGGLAMIVAPIVARGEFLGALNVAVTSEPTRLQPRRDLLDRLSGVVAQAASALQTARLVDKVTHQARHDGLTGLANRAVFTERIEKALAVAGESGEPVGLFFVDLDGFKAINDELGHHAGDELLCRVADRLLGTVRSNDTVARLGGDEFAIVLSGVGSHAVVDAAAERVARAFDEPFAVGGDQLMLGASVGRAVWPEDAYEIEALMRHADAAMYREKRAARARARVG